MVSSTTAAGTINQTARGHSTLRRSLLPLLDQAGGAFESSEEPEIRSLLSRISDYQARMEPLAYDCIGCKKCWGADATIELANHFDQVELDRCGSGDERSSGGIQSAIGSSNSSAHASSVAAWPPH